MNQNILFNSVSQQRIYHLWSDLIQLFHDWEYQMNHLFDLIQSLLNHQIGQEEKIETEKTKLLKSFNDQSKYHNVIQTYFCPTLIRYHQSELEHDILKNDDLNKTNPLLKTLQSHPDQGNHSIQEHENDNVNFHLSLQIQNQMEKMTLIYDRFMTYKERLSILLSNIFNEKGDTIKYPDQLARHRTFPDPLIIEQLWSKIQNEFHVNFWFLSEILVQLPRIRDSKKATVFLSQLLYRSSFKTTINSLKGLLMRWNEIQNLGKNLNSPSL